MLVQGDRHGGPGGIRAARAGGAGRRDRLRLVAQRRAPLRRLRQATDPGQTQAFPASEVPAARRHDRLVDISRTGATTEALDALRARALQYPGDAITADLDAPLPARPATWLLYSADERSAVSSRFIISSTLLRLHLPRTRNGRPVPAGAAEREAACPLLTESAERAEFMFLGSRLGRPGGREAALKLRRPRTWADPYPAMEYGTARSASATRTPWRGRSARCRPICSTTPPHRRHAIALDADPLAALIGVQRLAAALAERKGIDPDQPRALSRSVILA